MKLSKRQTEALASVVRKAEEKALEDTKIRYSKKKKVIAEAKRYRDVRLQIEKLKKTIEKYDGCRSYMLDATKLKDAKTIVVEALYNFDDSRSLTSVVREIDLLSIDCKDITELRKKLSI